MALMPFSAVDSAYAPAASPIATALATMAQFSAIGMFPFLHLLVKGEILLGVCKASVALAQSPCRYIATLPRMNSAYAYLGVAILAEVIATSVLKASDGMSKLGPTLASVLGYAVAFTYLSFTLKTIPTGIACALWSAIEIVLISIVSGLWFGQSLDAPAVGGLVLIVCGVVVINVFSKSLGH